jgi:hypothetical protein
MSLITIATLLISLALLIIVVLIVGRPLLRPAPVEPALTARGALLEQKAAILDQIRDLDFDFETHKIPQEVYEGQRAFLMEQAAETLQALDELPAAPADDDIVAQINEALLALRSSQAAPGSPGGDAAGFCPHCGQALDAGDRFCARCGKPISVLQPTA